MFWRFLKQFWIKTFWIISLFYICGRKSHKNINRDSSLLPVFLPMRVHSIDTSVTIPASPSFLPPVPDGGWGSHAQALAVCSRMSGGWGSHRLVKCMGSPAGSGYASSPRERRAAEGELQWGPLTHRAQERVPGCLGLKAVHCSLPFQPK